MNLWPKKQRIIDYQRTFGSPEGRRVLADLVRRCPLLKYGVSSGSAIDVNRLLVMTGEANIVRHIYAMLGRDPNEEKQETITPDAEERL